MAAQREKEEELRPFRLSVFGTNDAFNYFLFVSFPLFCLFACFLRIAVLFYVCFVFVYIAIMADGHLTRSNK
jgi:hypothetical protein